MRKGHSGSSSRSGLGAPTGLHASVTERHEARARLILDLEEVTTLDPSLPFDVAQALAGAAAATDEAQGPGAKDYRCAVTVNIGVIQGGLRSEHRAWDVLV